MSDDVRRLIDDLIFGSVFDAMGSVAIEPSIERCYGVLGLEPGVDQAKVKSRYRELAKRHHPDAGGSAETFVEIQAAYVEALAMTGGTQ